MHRIVSARNLLIRLALFAVITPALGQEVPAAGYIEVDGGQLYYEVAGAGKPIVLLHDGLLHRETWNLQFAELARSHRVVRYDRRGYGKSPAPEAPYSLVDDLAAVMDAMQMERATVIGMSAGGRLAVDFALTHPGRVSALILVGPVVSGMDFTGHFYSRGGRVTPELLADRTALRSYYIQKDPYNIAPGSTAAHAMAQELMDANPHNFDAVNNQLARLPREPAFGRLSEIKVPTLILVGEHDIADVHAHSGALEGGIAGAQRQVIAGSGHLVPLEQPEAFLASVQAFLSGGRFLFILKSRGVAEAADYFHRLRQELPDARPFAELVVNQTAYSYLFQGNVQDAVTLFRLNVEAYPESFNTWDSLGEALLARGDREGAKANYRKSLELNPDNRNAAQVLESLETAPAE